MPPGPKGFDMSGFFDLGVDEHEAAEIDGLDEGACEGFERDKPMRGT